MAKTPNIVTTASTQDHLDIADIRDDIVMMKSGAACVIIRTTAVNFGLLSETEQDSIIYAYAGFLNSLSFTVQILILSKKMDITSYLDLIKQQEQKTLNTALKGQIQKYHQFISSIIQENKVLDKSFYLVVPYNPLEGGLKTGASSILPKRQKKMNVPMSYAFEKAKNALAPRRDNVVRLLSRMGLKAQPLNTTELIKLFYEIYNPEEAIGQRMVSTSDYQTPIVQPVVEMPAPKNFNDPEPQAKPQPRPAQNRSAQVRQPVHRPATPVAPHPVATHGAGQPHPVTRPAPRPTSGQVPQVTMSDVQSVLNRLQSEVNKMQKGK